MGVPSYRFALNPSWGDVPHLSAVVHTPLAGDYHTGWFTTPLSLKSAPRGAMTYTTPRTRHRVNAGGALVLNGGQRYVLDIEAAERAATLCVFFEPGLVEEAARSARDTPRTLLESPAGEPAPFGTFEQVHAKSGALGLRLAALERGVGGGCVDETWLESQVLALALEVARLDLGARREALDFPGLRVATREEAYRRLHSALDYIEASFAERLSIARLARVACMSPFHFLRLFRRAFGETPMARVQRRRLEEAARLLRHSERPVARVCFDVGFESLGTFSALFKRRTGWSPGAFRKMSRIGEVARPGRL